MEVQVRWRSPGLPSLKIDTRMSSVSGTPGGGLPCIPSCAELAVAPEWARSSAVAGCGGLASQAAPSVRSSCDTTGRSSAVCVVLCPPSSVLRVPGAPCCPDGTYRPLWLAGGLRAGRPPAGSTAPGEAPGGARASGPGSAAVLWWALSPTVVDSGGSALPVGSPACAPEVGCWGPRCLIDRYWFCSQVVGNPCVGGAGRCRGGPG